MERTIIRNYPGTEDDPGHINWRRRFGRVQLLCPRCFDWFFVPRDIKFDKDGNASDSFYHTCDNGERDDDGGWVALVQLEGWKR